MPEVLEPPAWPCAPGQVHRISHEQFHAMDLPKQVVLKRGILVTKMTIGPRHAQVQVRLARLLRELNLPDFHVREDKPVLFYNGPDGGDSEPQPDLVLIRGTDDDLGPRHPAPAEIALLVEVADSSLREDREFLFDCAWFAVPRVWLVNLTNDTVEVYSDPVGLGTRRARHQQSQVFERGGGRLLDVFDGDRLLGRMSVDALLA